MVPGSREPGVVGRHGEELKLRVTALPERGRANEATVRLLARSVGVDPRGIRLVSGHGARDKIVEIDGIDQNEAERRLAG